jgi:hypothetical protein
MVSDDTRPLSRVYRRLPINCNIFHGQVYRRLPLMPRLLCHTVSTKLSSSELESLRKRAEVVGVTHSEYLRRLVLADQEFVTEDRLLRAVEAEHTRLVILAAQQGQKLTPELITNLRDKATLGASAQVQRTVRLLKQAAFPNAR